MDRLSAILRTKHLVQAEPAWFDAVITWYERSHLTVAILHELLPKRDGRAHTSINVNGRYLANVPEEHTRSRDEICWQIPENMLFVGDNNLAVALDRNSPVSLDCQSAVAKGRNVLPAQIVALDSPNPQAAAQMSLGHHERALHSGTAWKLQPGGQLLFRLTLTERELIDFSLSLPSRMARLGADLIEEIMEEVADAVRRRQTELSSQPRPAEPSARARFEEDLYALDTYSYLHHSQIRRAVVGGPHATLQQFIQEEPPPPPQPFSPPQTPAQSQSSQRPPHRPPPRRQSAGVFGKLLLVFLVFIAILIIVDASTNGSIQNLIGRTYAQVAAQFQRRPRNEKIRADNGGRQLVGAKPIDQQLRDKGAKTGDVMISLSWTNKNDLDLHVYDPTGNRLYWGNRRTPAGGVFQIDMNIGYEGASTKPVEHAYWPRGKAPKGTYKVYVNHYRNHRRPGCQDPTRFTVRIERFGRRQYFTGSVTYADNKKRKVLVHEFRLR